MRIAYLLTHPIQYISPLLRRLSMEKDIDVLAIYQSKVSIGKHYEKNFGREISWDIPLLEGYSFKFLPTLGRDDKLSYWLPVCTGFGDTLRKGAFDALIVHGYNRPFHWFAIWRARHLGVNVFVRDDATQLSKRRSWIKNTLKRLFFKILNSQCSGFLAAGQANRQYLQANGVSNHKIFDVPWAIDSALFAKSASSVEASRGALRESLGLSKDRPVVLYVGKLIKRKGILDLLNAFRIATDSLRPKPYLIVVGDGPLRAQIEREAKEIEGVFMVGFKNQTELPAFYTLGDLLVVPSLANETWGLVVNEAMVMAKAILASDRVGCWMDLVKHGRNGFVFPAGDVRELASCLRNALQDRHRLLEMGRESRSIVSAYSFEADIEGIRKCLAAAQRR